MATLEMSMIFVMRSWSSVSKETCRAMASKAHSRTLDSSDNCMLMEREA